MSQLIADRARRLLTHYGRSTSKPAVTEALVPPTTLYRAAGSAE